MNGVEILNETAIYENVAPVWVNCITFIITFALFWATIVLLILYKKSKDIADKECFKSSGLICLGFMTISVIAFMIGISNKTTIAYTEYQVTVDDSVSFNEFTEKYEIIDQEGKIYTIKEK